MKWETFILILRQKNLSHFSHHFSDEEVEQLVGQGVVPASKVSHGVQTGLGGNAGGPIDLPADTYRQKTQLLFHFKITIKYDRGKGCLTRDIK